MADKQVSIRPAEPNDAAALLALLKQLSTESATFSTDDLTQLTPADEEREITAIANTRTNLLMVAVIDDELIGVVTVQPTETEHLVGEVGVAVLKDVWGQGLGSALVDEALYWASDYSELEKLILTVQTRNQRAIALYQKLGFVRSSDQEHLVQDSHGEQVPAIEMQYQLK